MKEGKIKILFSLLFPHLVRYRTVTGNEVLQGFFSEQKCFFFSPSLFFFYFNEAVECVISELPPGIWKQPTPAWKRHYVIAKEKTLPVLRPRGRSQSVTSPFSGSLENTVFLWPLAKNSPVPDFSKQFQHFLPLPLVCGCFGVSCMCGQGLIS